MMKNLLWIVFFISIPRFGLKKIKNIVLILIDLTNEINIIISI